MIPALPPPNGLVLADLPRAGLGNKLLVWSRAYVFAQQHGLPFYCRGWVHLPVGSLLRRERSLRWYGRSFRPTNRLSPLRYLAARLRLPVVSEPTHPRLDPTLYVFRAVPAWQDYFAHVRDHRAWVQAAFERLVAPAVWQRARAMPAPTVGVHVRRADFGSKATPLPYFIDLIDALRNVVGYALPVTVFSDGHDYELHPLLALPNVVRYASGSDVVDLLQLSRSQVIIPSVGSTFGYWAGYVSNAILLRHAHDTRNGLIRPAALATTYYEGPLHDLAGAVSPTLRQQLALLRPVATY